MKFRELDPKLMKQKWIQPLEKDYSSSEVRI